MNYAVLGLFPFILSIHTNDGSLSHWFEQVVHRFSLAATIVCMLGNFVAGGGMLVMTCSVVAVYGNI
jgi:hypothetical protein